MEIKKMKKIFNQYSVKSEYNTSKFIKDIFGWYIFDDGGVMEVVLNLTSSYYFSKDQVDKAVEFASVASKNGHQVFLAPAVRKKDLGKKRSDGENVLGSRCLWVDVDPPVKTLPPDEMKQEAEKLLKTFIEELKQYRIKPSYIVSSGNGFHVYFHFQRMYEYGVDEWNEFQRALVELAKGDPQAKDMTRLLRFPGTINLKDKANPKPVEIIGGSGHLCNPDDFKKIVRDFPKTKTVSVVPSDIKPLGFIPPCIESLLNPESKPPLGNRHQVRRVVSTFLFGEGVSMDDAIQQVMHTTDDPKKAEADVKGVYNVLELNPGRYSIGCNEGSELRSLVDSKVTICDKDNCQFGKPKTNKSEKEEKKKIPSAWFPGLIDLVLADDGEIAFLVLEDGNLALKKEYPSSEGVLVPPDAKHIQWLLPRYSKVLKYFNNDDNKELFDDLVNHLQGISDLPSNNHYMLNALWLMHTYLFDMSSYSPIIWFYAIAGRGKTRTGNGLTYIAWRGVSVITVREPHVIRLANDHRATIFFDCTDLEKKMKKSGSDDVFLCRFEQGKKVARVIHPDKGPFYDTEYYDVYGPTIIATNEPVNAILESRSIQTIMPESDRIFNDDVIPEDGLLYRERLVAFRARVLKHQNLPTVDKPIRGRLGDIMRPLLQVLKLFSFELEWFFEILYEFDRNLKENISESREAQVVRAIYELRCYVSNERLSNEKILDCLNADRPERYHMTPKSLGWITKSLNFKKYSDGKQRGIYWDENLVAMLCGRYGINYKQNNGILTI